MCKLEKKLKVFGNKITDLEISESYKAIAVNFVQVCAFNVNFAFACIKRQCDLNNLILNT